MKAKELIERLEKIVAEHGDLDVEYAEMEGPSGDHGHASIVYVDAYDAGDNFEGERTHICLI